MKNILFVLILLVAIASCKKDEPNNGVVNPATVEQLTDEDYAIYNALFITKSSITYLVNVTDTFLNCADLNMFELDSIKVTESVINQCIEVNKAKFLIEEGKMLSGGIRLIDKNNLTEMGWEVALNQYAGFMQIGHPLVYDNGVRAIVETMYYCGSLCASWNMHYLEKVQGVWVEKGMYMTKVSK